MNSCEGEVRIKEMTQHRVICQQSVRKSRVQVHLEVFDFGEGTGLWALQAVIQ